MPLVEILRWAVAILFSGILVAASISDMTTRLIPNWTVLAIAALFALRAMVTPLSATISALEAAVLMFLVSFGLYAFRVVGAGDSKLVTVTALFVGLEGLPQFAFATSLVGGAVAVVSLAADPQRALVMIQMRGKGDWGPGIPYGVAIAAAGLFVFLPTLLPLSR